MPVTINAAAPIPFRLVTAAGLPVAVDPADITVRGFGPGGGPVGDTLAGQRITVMDAGVYQYLAPQGELAYPGLWLYLFDAVGAKTAEVRFDVDA